MKVLIAATALVALIGSASASCGVRPGKPSPTPTMAPEPTMTPEPTEETPEPTEETPEPTEDPVDGSNAAGDAESWWKPTPGTSYQIQLTGELNLSYDVQMMDIDMYDTPAETIADLQAKGIKVVCYFSAGTYEDWRSDKDEFTSDMYGLGLPDWPGENWLDTRNEKVRAIMTTRIQYAKDKGCDAVDPDNVDAAFNDSGFDLTAETQLEYNTFLADTAHSLGLAVGLKNDLAQAEELSKVFDFAVNEQCAQYDECETLLPFIEKDKPVFGIEYEGDKASVCAAANSLNMDTLFKDMDLKGERFSCREEA